jgi:hypothetical protein
MQRAIEEQPVESEDKAVNSVAGRVASDKVDCIVKVAPRSIDLEARPLRKKPGLPKHLGPAPAMKGDDL